MPAREINLIPEKHHLSTQEIKSQRSFILKTTSYLSAYLIASILIIMYSLYLGYSMTEVDAKIKAEKDRISQLDKYESIYLLLKQKAAAISGITQKRFPLADQTDFIIRAITQFGKIKSLSLNSQGEMDIDLELESSEKINDLTQAILVEASKRYAYIEIKSVSLTAENRYSLKLDIDAKKNI